MYIHLRPVPGIRKGGDTNKQLDARTVPPQPKERMSRGKRSTSSPLLSQKLFLFNRFTRSKAISFVKSRTFWAE